MADIWRSAFYNFKCILMNENDCTQYSLKIFRLTGPIDSGLLLPRVMAWRRLGVDVYMRR